jgi:hypothetical protein
VGKNIAKLTFEKIRSWEDDIKIVGFEVRGAETTKGIICSDVISRGPIHRRFGETFYFHLQAHQQIL